MGLIHECCIFCSNRGQVCACTLPSSSRLVEENDYKPSFQIPNTVITPVTSDFPTDPQITIISVSNESSDISLTEYLKAKKIEIKGRKTPIYKLYNVQHPDVYIAEIKWFGNWRQYCLYTSDSIFDKKCLEAVVKFLDDLNKR